MFLRLPSASAATAVAPLLACAAALGAQTPSPPPVIEACYVPATGTTGQAVNRPVATFVPSNVNTAAADYTASIAWSDGSTETPDVQSDGDAVFLVQGLLAGSIK